MTVDGIARDRRAGASAGIADDPVRPRTSRHGSRTLAPVRIAVVGKGGAGKSVVAGTLARLAARAGDRVLALDSDLLPGLSFSLGSGPEPAEAPLGQAAVQDADGRWGWRDGIDAASAAQRFSTAGPDGIRLLQRGKVAREGFPAVLAASKAFWEVVHGLVDAPEFHEWTLIGDLPAGPSQTVRDWAPYARTYVVVVQPSSQSAMTARRIARLARLHAPTAGVVFVANRVAGEDDVHHVERWIGEPVRASVPVDEEVAAAERLGVAPIDYAPGCRAIVAMRSLLSSLCLDSQR